MYQGLEQDKSTVKAIREDTVRRREAEIVTREAEAERQRRIAAEKFERGDHKPDGRIFPSNKAAGPWPYPANQLDLLEAPAGSFVNLPEGNITTGVDGVDGLEVISVCVNMKMTKEDADKLRRLIVNNREYTQMALASLQYETWFALGSWFNVETIPLT